MIDDKLKLLEAMKRVLVDQLTTAFVRQGHYAADQKRNSNSPAPDVTVDRIGDLCEFAMDRFCILKPSHAQTPAIGDKEFP